ncbi:MAG: exodeoxyribonuclease VII small subunit [Methanobrevibacter sp.]|jgi:exodeoxyribonuclease VII small subunit|nr:exodeoxyribonuclease VII small subunit [Methanobrevibacter sp.]
MTKKFEEKLGALENLVKELESGDVDLELAIEKYTEAMSLVNQCDKELKETREKIKVVSEDGQLKDFEYINHEDFLKNTS